MLTRREKEILKWLSAGKTAWEIGQIMGLSGRTVEWKIGRITRRLGVSNRVHAVAHSLCEQIIECPKGGLVHRTTKP